jgi:pantoate--beta-alanine ligase
MVRDLNFDVEIIVCPTVREDDGLAMSSRNKYLDAGQRTAASALYRSLRVAEALWQIGVRDSDQLRTAMEGELAAEPLAKVEYVSVANTDSLVEWQGQVPSDESALLSLAVYFGTTRLIDNLVVE